MPASIRLATESDAEPMLAIYAPVVRDTAISFELEPPDANEFRSRIARVMQLAPWLVYEVDGAVAGYAYATRFRARPAYRFTAETTVYVHAAHRGRGVGRALYTVLLDALRLQGFRRAVGGIALPNDASVALHENAGFRPVGVFTRVGFKFGRWHDVGFWDMELAEAVPDPPEPLPLCAVAATPEWRGLLDRAASGVG
jgi:phosphinothricin acetyltransferase